MKTQPPQDVCIVGASLAGLRTAQALRKHGYANTITMIGAELHPPYDRPPLSKQLLLGTWEPAQTELASEDELKLLDVDLRLGATATSLDLDRRIVHIGPEPVTFDRLVIATGAQPRSLPLSTPGRGVISLRTLEDSLELRRHLVGGNARVVVVGAGFIGLEVAAACRASGAEVTIVEMLPQPLSAVLGEEIGTACATWQTDHGVEVRCGVFVEEFRGDETLLAVRLSDGSIIPADVAVVGIGVEPSVDWLAGSGLTIDGGVICDDFCFAAPGVVAVGDVARWHHRGYGLSTRVEHWTNAVEQASVAAANLLAEPEQYEAYQPTPYFWSDQFGTRLQFVGRHQPGDEVHVQKAVRGLAGDFVALFTHDGRLTGAFAFGAPRAFMKLRRLVVAGGSLSDARELLAA